jgi:hypothetical protein
MKTKAILFLVMIGPIMKPPCGTAHELCGHIEVEHWFFFYDPLDTQQEDQTVSIAIQPEYHHEWENGSGITFIPFARFDKEDSERTHFDIRELYWSWFGDVWEVRVGIDKVFWGVTEFVHLVDIINQTDLVEDIDEEVKLGQPMVNLSLIRDWGIVSLFIMPGFRERTFPGIHGRLRPSIIVDTDNPRFESSAEERQVDFAARYSHSIEDLDIGIYYFHGTGREPTLFLMQDYNGQQVLIPYYVQIGQTGLDAQLTHGQWLFKVEGFNRVGQGDAFFAATGGVEYTFPGIAGSKIELGLIGEGAWDERQDLATTPFENDVMGGFRLQFNDAGSMEVLGGISYDFENTSKLITLEASRRFGNHLRFMLESRFFIEPPEDDPLFDLREDDFIRWTLSYYF